MGAPGTLLGLVPDPELTDEPTELGAGDALVLYTDGITEARAPERILGDAELLAALAAVPPGSAQRIVEQLAALAMGKRARRRATTSPCSPSARAASSSGVAGRLAVVVVRRVGVRARLLAHRGLAAVGASSGEAPGGPSSG